MKVQGILEVVIILMLLALALTFSSEYDTAEVVTAEVIVEVNEPTWDANDVQWELDAQQSVNEQILHSVKK
jgi:hypothetical protein